MDLVSYTKRTAYWQGERATGTIFTEILSRFLVDINLCHSCENTQKHISRVLLQLSKLYTMMLQSFWKYSLWPNKFCGHCILPFYKSCIYYFSGRTSVYFVFHIEIMSPLTLISKAGLLPYYLLQDLRRPQSVYGTYTLRLRIRGAIPNPHYVFVSWRLYKHRSNFTLETRGEGKYSLRFWWPISWNEMTQKSHNRICQLKEYHNSDMRQYEWKSDPY
jgi:hypothetical protein